MAFILVFILHKSKAYSFDDCQIGVLQMQSKGDASMAALHGAHGWRHDFFIFNRTFEVKPAKRVAFLRQSVVFCKCEKIGRRGKGDGNPLADVPFSC
jgi:hypothetical protein